MAKLTARLTPPIWVSRLRALEAPLVAVRALWIDLIDRDESAIGGIRSGFDCFFPTRQTINDTQNTSNVEFRFKDSFDGVDSRRASRHYVIND